MKFFIRYIFWIILHHNYCGTLQSLENFNHTVKSPDLFDYYGMWGTPAFCSPGTYVIGYNIKYQTFQGSAGDSFGRNVFLRLFNSVYDAVSKNRDDKGLTGVELICASSWTTRTPQMNIRSQSSSGGMWHKYKKYCPAGFANGFEVKVQSPQGWADDTGITNFKLLCNGSHLRHHNLSFQPGHWETAKCPHKTLLCGFKSKVEEDHLNDDTGLNALEGYCCNPHIDKTKEVKTKEAQTNGVKTKEAQTNGVKTKEAQTKEGRIGIDIDEAETCQPTYSTQMVLEADNSHGEFEKRYVYTLRIGIEDMVWSKNTDIDIEDKDQRPELDVETDELKMQRVILRNHIVRQLSWRKASEKLSEFSNAWVMLQETSETVDVPQGLIARIYEEVIDCGNYRVWSGQAKIVDFSFNNILHDKAIVSHFPISRVLFPTLVHY